MNYSSANSIRAGLDGKDATTRGRLIVICGIDGSGKSTQEEFVGQWHRDRGLSFAATRQPTDVYRRSAAVRKYLDHGIMSVSFETLALMAAADRMQHVDRWIVPRLNKGCNVVCNRFVYSSYAYFQARGVNRAFLHAINSRVPEPDGGILLVCDPWECSDRVRARDEGKTKYEEANVTFMARVQDYMYREWPSTFLTVDGMLSRTEIAGKISEYLTATYSEQLLKSS